MPRFVAADVVAAADVAGLVEDAVDGEVDRAHDVTDLATLEVRMTGPATLNAERTLKGADRSTTEPGFDADGWKIWSGDTRSDGYLEVRFQHTYAAFAPSGTYTWTLTAEDKAGETITSQGVQVTVNPFTLIEVSSTPVLADGTPDTASGWGNWTAQPGASSVSSTNYIKLVNTGDLTDATVVVDFTDAAFTGANETNEVTIPIDDNIRFAWFEDATPSITAPNEGSFDFGTTSSEGSVTLSFSGTGNVIYVAYQVVEMPDVLPIDTYSASYTVTEL